MHEHGIIYSEKFSPTDEIAFHSKLREWLVKYWDLLPTESILVQERGCDDNSCPVMETYLIAENEWKEMTRSLKLGKAKHLIAKQDIVFSVDKQGKNNVPPVS
jgi:hypothetical protein